MNTCVFYSYSWKCLKLVHIFKLPQTIRFCLFWLHELLYSWCTMGSLLTHCFILIRMQTVKDSVVLNMSILKMPRQMKRKSTIEDLHNTWRKMGVWVLNISISFNWCDWYKFPPAKQNNRLHVLFFFCILSMYYSCTLDDLPIYSYATKRLVSHCININIKIVVQSFRNKDVSWVPGHLATYKQMIRNIYQRWLFLVETA